MNGPKAGTGVTRAKVKRLALKGLSATEISRVLKISREAAGQHLRRLRADGELPLEEIAS